MKQQEPAGGAVLLALAAGVISISFAAIFFKLAAPTPPSVAAGVRLTIACALMSPFTVRARLQGRLPGVVVRAGVVCGLFYGLHFGAWVTSLSLTSVAASVTLVTATPLFLGLIGRWTGTDAPGPSLWWAIGLAAVGTVIIGWADLSADPQALIGDALALVGALAMVGYLLHVRRLGGGLKARGLGELDVLAFAGITTGVGAASLLAVSVVVEGALRLPSAEALGWLALAALIPQLIGHNALTWVLRRTTPTVVGLSTVGEPVVSAALGWLWLGEAVSFAVGLGCAVVLAGITLGLLRR